MEITFFDQVIFLLVVQVLLQLGGWGFLLIILGRLSNIERNTTKE